MSGLTENGWILITASAFNLLWYVILGEDKKKSCLIWICNWKRGDRRDHLKGFWGSQGFCDYTLATNNLAPPVYYSISLHKEASPLVWEFWPQASFEENEAGKRPYKKIAVLKVRDGAPSSDRNFGSKSSWPKCQWNIAQKTHQSR